MNTNKPIFSVMPWLGAGLVCLYLAGGDQPMWPAVWLAPLFFLRFFRKSGSWLAFPIALPFIAAVDMLADRGMTPFPSFKILLFYTALGAAFSLVPYFIDRLLHGSLPLWLRTLLFPSLAVALSFIRGDYGTWGAKANGIHDLALLQLVSVTGVAGISFLINWTAAAANEIWEAPRNPRVVRNFSVALLCVLALVYGFGMVRLRLGYKPAHSLLSAGLVHDPSYRDELINAFTVLIRNDPSNPAAGESVRNSMKVKFHQMLADSVALADAGFNLAVWCEGAVVLFDEDEQSMIEAAAEAAREKGIYLGMSAAVYQKKNRGNKPGVQPLFKNKLILISPNGDIAWEYSKSILVPGLEAAISIPGDRIMKTSGPPAGITGAICYELDFPSHIRQAKRLKAGLILGPANDWEAIKNIHARMARLRAIETGISLLRPANGGVSIAVDPYGRILAQVDAYASRGAPIAAAVPLDPVPTVYSMLGDYFSWWCLTLSLVCVTWGTAFRLVRKYKPAYPSSQDSA